MQGAAARARGGGYSTSRRVFVVASRVARAIRVPRGRNWTAEVRPAPSCRARWCRGRASRGFRVSLHGPSMYDRRLRHRPALLFLAACARLISMTRTNGPPWRHRDPGLDPVVVTRTPRDAPCSRGAHPVTRPRVETSVHPCTTDAPAETGPLLTPHDSVTCARTGDIFAARA